jgi:hypothetical protein
VLLICVFRFGSCLRYSGVAALGASLPLAVFLVAASYLLAFLVFTQLVSEWAVNPLPSVPLLPL